MRTISGQRGCRGAARGTASTGEQHVSKHVLKPAGLVQRQWVVPAAGGLLGGLFGGGDQPGSAPAQQQQTSAAAAPPPQPAAAAAAAADGGGAPAAPVGRATEFPPFQTVSKGPVYDLRFYEPYAVVEMDYRRRENAYLTLGQYQDGANAASTAFNFTQPVVMTYYPDVSVVGRKTMSMLVGSPRSAAAAAGPRSPADLPAPNSPDVRLSVAGGEVVAVLRFSGYITPQTAEAARRQLADALAKDGLKLAEPEQGGLFRVAQYGQVYTLEERLNEMLLRVQL